MPLEYFDRAMVPHSICNLKTFHLTYKFLIQAGRIRRRAACKIVGKTNRTEQVCHKSNRKSKLNIDLGLVYAINIVMVQKL